MVFDCSACVSSKAHEAGTAYTSMLTMRRFSTVDGMLAAAVGIWAFAVPLTKYALTHGLGPLTFAVIRYGVAAVLFAALTLVLDRSLRVSGRRNLELVAFATITLLVNQFCFLYALKLADATTVALIFGITPIVAGLTVVCLGLDRPSVPFWVGTALSVAGVALVAGGSGVEVSANLAGAVLALGVAVSWAVYSVVIAPLMRSYSPYRISAIVLAMMWVPLVAVSAPQVADQSYASVEPLAWMCLAFATVFSLVITNVLWFRSVHRVGAARATLLANLQPFLAAVLSALLLSEAVHWVQVIGGVAILCGVLVERVSGQAPIGVPRDP